MYRRLFALLLVSSFAFAGKQPASAPEMSRQTRLQMIRLLNAEFAFARKPFPMGQKGLTIKPNGQLSPNDADLYNQIVQKGISAKAGERIQITNVDIKKDAIVLEINGGPVKKKKWYQRIQVSGPTGATVGAQEPDQMAKGSFLTVQFKDHVPEMTLADFKKIVEPVFDFTVKSAAQAYTETLPENVRNAIRDHQVLVGMSKEMVTYAKGRPPKRLREKDPQGHEYEEWIYGEPPADVDFVRSIGEEVIQLKTMKVGGEKIVKTEKEVDLKDPSVITAAAALQREQEAEKAREQERTDTTGVQKGPTLRRPGEAPPANTNDRQPTPPVINPSSVPPTIPRLAPEHPAR